MLSLVVWSALLVGFISLQRVSLVRLRVQNAARLGTFLQATGRVSDAAARSEINDALTASLGVLSSAWTVETGRYLDSASSKFYRLMKTRVRATVRGFPQPVDEIVVCEQEEKM